MSPSSRSTHVVPGPQRRHLPSGMRSPSFYLLELFRPPRLTIFPPAVSSSPNYIPDDKQIATPNTNLTLLYFRKYFVCIVSLNLHNRVC